MTWYADEILVRASAPALAAVRADAELRAFAHLLPIESIRRPGESLLGAALVGLCVVRPVADPIGHEQACHWYGAPFLDSHELTGNSEISAWHQSIARQFGEAAPVPPVGSIARLKDLATSSGEAVAYYSCAMWGGDVEFEQAWILGSNDQVFLKNEQGPTVALSESAPPREVQGDVLRLALAALGIELPSTYFEPHTRSFPWDRYRL